MKKFIKSLYFVLFTTFFISCQNQSDNNVTTWQKQAQNVNIIRDTYGVPHIYGKSDADAVFGMMYAQCEDDFNRVEHNYIWAIGRLAEVEGEGAIYSDLRARLFMTKAQDKNYKTIQFATSDGGTVEADLFLAKENMAIIFAHGAVFNKESWHFLALKLQKEGVTGLSINFRGYGKSKKGSSNNRSLDVLGAVTYLKNKGYKSIVIVGGSMGGAAVVNALNTKYDKIITKVVLMAPAGGKALKYKTLHKFFIVSEKEGLYNRVMSLYESSAEPKKLSTYKGSFHAQNMFKADYAESLTKEIINFIKS